MMLAQFSLAGYSLLQILALTIIVAAGAMITVAILKAMGTTIPDVFIKVFWIIVFAAFGILALIFLFSLVARIGAG